MTGNAKSGLEALSHCAIKIEGYSNAAPQNVSFGTGFFYNLETERGTIQIIVSNKHVMVGFDKLVFHYAEQSSNGERLLQKAEKVCVDINAHPIVEHPDPNVDLACIAIEPMLQSMRANGQQPYFVFLNDDNLPPKWLEKRLIASTSALMVGFPNGLMDEQNNLPIMRKGILATPFYADHNGQKNFVIDIAAFGGSSGSPIFAHFESIKPTKDGNVFGQGGSVYLIGILHSGPTFSAIGKIVTIPVPTSGIAAVTQNMMHLGYCAKAPQIKELAPSLIKIYNIH